VHNVVDAFTAGDEVEEAIQVKHKDQRMPGVRTEYV
jgi:hypothetical protein